MNITSLLERCKYEIEFAAGVFPRAEHPHLIKDLEAAIAEQAKPQEPDFTSTHST